MVGHFPSQEEHEHVARGRLSRFRASRGAAISLGQLGLLLARKSGRDDDGDADFFATHGFLCQGQFLKHLCENFDSLDVTKCLKNCTELRN